MSRRFLVLRHLKIHNANALSSPFTIGFPAMTAWLGFVHALQRKLNTTYPSLHLIATGVVSHQCDLQTYRGPEDFVSSIVGTGNPLDAKGNRSSFIEEARCHLDVSLIIEYQADEHTEDAMISPKFITSLKKQLVRMRVAGGDLQTFDEPEIKVLAGNKEKEHFKMMCSLMPGYVLLERRELMKDSMEQGDDALKAMLEYLTIHHECHQDAEGRVTWSSHRKVDSQGRSGWIVPIATGFHGVSPLGYAKNQRDSRTLHRFAESVVTLGEFRMAHRINHIDEVLWRYHADLDNNLYLCQQSTSEHEEAHDDGFS